MDELWDGIHGRVWPLGYIHRVLMSFKLVFSTDNATSLGGRGRLFAQGVAEGAEIALDRRGSSFGGKWIFGIIGSIVPRINFIS